MSPQARPNPYVGPRPFETGEKLYGRDQEVMELLDLLIAERIVLLYSPSGAGKTSLVQAALVPEMEREGFKVLPVMRVSLVPPPRQQLPEMTNRYVLSLLLSLEKDLPTEQQAPVAELASLELGDYLDRRWPEADPPATEVLIFDQFEEILTVNPTDRAAKEAFFGQVGAVLRRRHRWALFVMREEYLAGLDPYLRPIPTRLSTTFRVELLQEEAARLAMQRPAHEVGVDFTDAAAGKLVNDLRMVRVQQPDGKPEEQLGLYVEPVQLQVVCRRLWEKLPADATEVGEADVVAVGDVDSALSGYYGECVASIAKKIGVSERAIREWFDRSLITEQGIRGQVLHSPEQSQGLENQAIWPLVDAHLVRVEKRRGANWFELAHDRLINPLRKNNAEWYPANLSALQQQAASWQKQDRSSGLLLSGEKLAEAELWAATQVELTQTEDDFLAACQEARTIAERDRRQARRIRRLAIGASIIGAIAFMAFIVATYQNRKAVAAKIEAGHEATNARTAKDYAEERQGEAERLLKVSRSWALAAQVPRQHGLAQHEQGALLARQAYLFNQQGQGDALAHVADVLRTVLSAPYFSHILPGHEREVLSVAFSPDGNDTRLASGGSDGTIRLWELGTPEAAPTVLPGHAGEVRSVAFSRDGRRLASGGRDGTIQLWKLDTPEAAPTVLPGHEREVLTVAFSADGTRLASGSDDGTIRLWELDRPKAEPTVLRGHKGAVQSVAFSPKDTRLASGSDDGTIRLWELDRPKAEPTVLRGHKGAVQSVAFSPKDTRLASGGSDGTIRLWELGRPKAKPTVLRGHDGAVRSVAFSADGTRLASGSDDKTIRLWEELGRPEPKSTVLPGHERAVWSVAFSPDGTHLASGGDDRTIRLWKELGTPNARPTSLGSHESEVRSVAFSADNTRLTSVSRDGTIQLWELGTPKAKPAVLRGHEGAGWSLAFSPDGTRLASGSSDGTIRLWKLDTPEAAPTVLRGHKGGVWSLAFSPDGTRLASGSSDGTIQLWKLDTPEAAPTVLRGHEGGVLSLAFSPKDTRLASGSSDGTIRLWELGTPEAAPTVLRGHEGWVLSVAFSPDGTHLASGGDDRTIRLWKLDTPKAAPTDEALAEEVCAKVWRNLLLDEWRKFVGPAAPYDRTCPNLPVHPSFIEAGQNFARSGKLDDAIAIFQRVRELDPSLPLDPQAEAGRLVTQGLTAYAEAQTRDPTLRISAQSWKNLCWFGSLWGRAADVMKACEQAVTRAPEDGGSRDSRGIARALTSNVKGAIEDFQAFIAWTEAKQQYEPNRAQRQRWIEELRAGKNPFTPEEIEKLRKQ